MTLSKNELHVYLRNIDTHERTSLSVLVGLMDQGARVLDVGCGSGALGQYLHTHKQCTVDGVTFNAAEAELARGHYRRVEVANLEQTPLSQLFGAERYDFIVCADILEHLREPEALLRDAPGLLAPGGRLLISIPNSNYAGLVAELAEGEFRYREEGLLDATHVRHVTRTSLLRLLQESGWQVLALEAIERALHESEFTTWFDHLPPAVARYLLARPDALTYQFIVAATPAEAAADNSAWLPTAAGAPAAAQACFSAQVYWDDGNGFSEARKCVQPAAIGQDRQTLRFELPPDLADLQSLKLDPADRPGILHLYALALQNLEGETLWRWQQDAEGLDALLDDANTHQVLWGGRVLGSGAQALALTGDDPWLTLPIAPAQLAEWARAAPLVLRVELGWPMSADYLSLINVVAPLQSEQRFLRTQAAEQLAQINQTARERERLALELAQLHRAHAELHRDQAELSQQLAGAQDTLRSEQQKKDAELADLHQQLRGMADHLSNMRNSRVFRYTRPLVHLRDVVKGRAPLFGHEAGAGDPLPAGSAATSPEAPSQPSDVGLPIPAPRSETVDIIVPVYRGLADTQLCVESVLASAVTTPYRLIAINDCSPEPEVTQWLRDKAAQEPRITLLENAENLGFVGTVNRGMRESDSHDVLLLNSDTEVANDWLDRLRAAAYSGARAGTVTPFSSNATICSYPVFCTANPLPEGYTTATLDQLFATANAGQHVDVPTGVGFCMYIRRDCLDQVGLFDEDHFGKGYGEENDFCQRAIQQGWRNLHALDTYVLHTGGVSFGESKSPREQAAMDTLRRLHPDYEVQVHQFLQRDPARQARLAVDWLRHTDGGKRPVILAVHHQRGGGTERHVLELAHSLAGRATFVSLRPAGAQQVQLQLVEPDPTGERQVLSTTWSAIFHVEHQRGALLELLRALGVVHVHYHHLLGHDTVAWELPELLGVSHDFTTHDFYSFCTNITMTGRHGHYEMDAQGECCGGAHPAPIPPVEEDIAAWRGRNRRLLEGARFVLSPGLDAATRIHRFAPAARLRFAPHTDVDAATLPLPEPRRLGQDQPLRIAIIGALSVIKGADVLEQAALLAKRQGLPLEFHLIGFAYRHLQTQPATALKVHGQYDERDLPAMLQRLAPDLVWLPAQWPETYSYTLSAALQQGLAVAVPDLGAFAERVAGRPWSWVLPWNLTAEQWTSRFVAMRELHFATGLSPEAPTMPSELAEARARWSGWDYAAEYLLPPAPLHEAGGAQLAAVLVANSLGQAAQPSQAGTSAGHGRRSRLLQGLVRLRAMPLMRPIAKAIPPQFQARVKGWLQR